MKAKACKFMLLLALIVLPGAGFSQTEMFLKDEAKFQVWEVTFPSPFQNAVPSNPTVFVEYYKPKVPGSVPAVILLHHWGC